jgi:hypothetical protein
MVRVGMSQCLNGGGLIIKAPLLLLLLQLSMAGHQHMLSLGQCWPKMGVLAGTYFCDVLLLFLQYMQMNVTGHKKIR